MGNVRKMTEAEVQEGTEAGYRLPLAGRNFAQFVTDLSLQAAITTEAASIILSRFQVVLDAGFADCIHAIQVFTDELDQRMNVKTVVGENFPALAGLVTERDPSLETLEAERDPMGRHTEDEGFK